MKLRLIQGDCFEVLRGIAEESVQCVVTSPPYYGLRDYGTARWEGGNSECDHKEARHKNRFDYPLQKGEVYQATNAGSAYSKYDEICPTCGAVKKDGQIGLEQSPEEYVAKMVDVFREVRRVLRDDGTVWLNLGDSYATHASGSKNHSHNFRSPEVAAINGIGTL